MIGRVSSRGNGAAAHKYLFYGSKDNDQVEFVGAYGTIAQDAYGAMVEMDKAAGDTKGINTLVHLVISPADRYSLSMKPEEWDYAVEEFKQAINLKGQPHASVRHFKDNSWHQHTLIQRAKDGFLEPDNYTAYKINKARAKIEKKLGHDITPEYSQHRPLFQKANFKAWQEAKDGQEYIEKMREQGYIMSRNQTKDPWQAVSTHTKNPQTFSVIKNLKDRWTETYITKKEVYERLSGIALPADKEVIRDIKSQRETEAMQRAREIVRNAFADNKPKENQPQQKRGRGMGL
jgi:hypothetical protein